ncbi:MAG TPA: hypothetical protein VHW44_33600 [Pseudonocardiaceae bacterium]|jgi:hypothetical protein|nr:hypothetical protein [Pseudonocardiaceae bacterium]
MLVVMGKHRQPEFQRSGLFGRRKQRDNLFERSFQECSACGADVYVLASDCRACGQELELIAG